MKHANLTELPTHNGTIDLFKDGQGRPCWSDGTLITTADLAGDQTGIIAECLRDYGMRAHIVERVECSLCGCDGYQVDTTCGERIIDGAALYVVPETVSRLMVDDRGELLCDECASMSGGVQ